MEEKLIEAVQMFPCLYDKSKQDYRNKLKKEKSWAAVAAATGTTVEICQGRWQSLRDRYVREMVSAKPKSGDAAEEKKKWCYMEALSFLQKHVTPRRTFSNMQWASSELLNLVEIEDSEVIEVSPCTPNTSSMSFNFDESATASTEEELPRSSSTRPEKRRKIKEEAHQKFDQLCGAVTDLIAAKKDTSEKSRNSDFFKVLDSYLLKHSEEEQDRLKIEILSLVYKRN